jgi:hypothetical protein
MMILAERTKKECPDDRVSLRNIALILFLYGTFLLRTVKMRAGALFSSALSPGHRSRHSRRKKFLLIFAAGEKPAERGMVGNYAAEERIGIAILTENRAFVPIWNVKI